MNDRMPPHNADLEAALIGAVIREPEYLDDATAEVAAEDFWVADHAELWRLATSAADSGRPIDSLALDDQLRRLGWDDRRREVLTTCLERAALGCNARHHALHVREKAQRRRLIDACRQTEQECYAGDSTAAEVAAAAEARVFAVAEREAVGETRPAGEFVAEVISRLDKREAGEVSGVATGLVDLDGLTDGLGNAQLVVLAARPSIGKTGLALGIAEHAAFAAGVGTLFVSLEMAGSELVERLAVMRSGVDGFRVRTARLAGFESDQFRAGLAEVRACDRLWIDDTPLRSPAQIAANARRHRARYGIGLVIVDYIQLIEAGDAAARKASRQEQVAGISRRLKVLAKELDVPVLTLSQLNRQAEAREDRRPRLSDLRESGAIEQDADVVMLLHRPEFYDPNDRPGEAELIVAKNRNGGTGTIRLAFRKSLARFNNFQHEPEPEPDFGPPPINGDAF